jgi:hypothetical protein
MRKDDQQIISANLKNVVIAVSTTDKSQEVSAHWPSSRELADRVQVNWISTYAGKCHRG